MAPTKSMSGWGLVSRTDKIKEDAFFDKSPFNSTPTVKLQFKQGEPFTVHQALLQRYPKLALLGSVRQNAGLLSQPVPSLDHISRSAGHVLVNYLYTGTYQTLDWTGPTTGGEQTIAKLRTGFEVYAAARQFGLHRLEELTKEQISLLSKEINAFTVIDVVSEAYPASSDNDTWFLLYMKAVIRTAFEGAEARSKTEVSENDREGDVSTAKTLLRGAVEVYREMVESLVVKEAPVALEEPAQVPPERSQPEDANTPGFETAGDTKREAEYAVELEPEPEPEPAPDLTLTPEAVAPGLENNDTYGVGTAKKLSKKEKKEKRKKMKNSRAFGLESEPEHTPMREPTPQLAKTEDNTIAGNYTSVWGPFGVSSSTTSTLVDMKNKDVAIGSTANTSAGSNSGARGLFNINDTTSTPFGTDIANKDAAVGGTPGTASPAFTPTREWDSMYTNSFQNIVFMDAYRKWSSEELRLADYSRATSKEAQSVGRLVHSGFL